MQHNHKMKTYTARQEPNGVGFRIMFPTPESRIEDLKKMRNPNPITEEQAIQNQKITKQIQEIINELNTF